MQPDPLAIVRGRRGYVLNYHRLMAAHDPALLLSYDAFYAALTLEGRHLAGAEREVVWLALLAAAGQGQGRLHIDRARALGMSGAVIAEAVALGSGGGAAAMAPGIAVGVAEVARGVAFAVGRRWGAMRGALGAARAAGVQEGAVVEGLSFLMIPCGVASFFEAASAWGRDGGSLLEDTAPGLAQALAGFHRALLICPRALPDRERAVLMGVLRGLGVRLAAGLRPVPRAARGSLLVGALLGWRALDFVGRRWAADVPGFDAAGRYAASLRAAAPGVSEATRHLAGLLLHAVRQDGAAVRLHLLGAFGAGASAAQVAETLTYIRLGGTGAAFIAGIDAWVAAAQDGLCPWPYPEDA